MHKKRLLKLADYMEKVEADKYRQDTWFDGVLDQNEAELKPIKGGGNRQRVVIKEGVCGTSACVLGHAVAAVPEARLFWYAGASEIDFDHEGFVINGLGIAKTVKGRLEVGFEAAAGAFDIPVEHAGIMFAQLCKDTCDFYGTDYWNEQDHPTPGQVAVALRKYVELDGDIRSVMGAAKS
jgi:hypothetical protein